MQRRDALRAARAVLAGPAGCLGDGDAGPGPGTTTESAREWVELGASVDTEAYGLVRVRSVTVQTSLIYSADRPWREVADPAGDQLVVVSGLPSDAGPGVTMDGEPVERSPRVDRDGNGTVDAVAVPVRPSDTAAVVVDGTDSPAWRLPASVRDDLAVAASFRVRDGRMRTEGGDPVFELTVENVGDADGTFRGVTALSNDRDGPIRVPVPAGETVTRSVTDPFFGTETTLDESPSPRTRAFRVEN